MITPKPEWLKIKIRTNPEERAVEEILKRLALHTVCQEALCPNRMECFSSKTATFMILGRVCTRNCTFCNVESGEPSCIDADEPEKIASAVQELGLSYVVITSVTRDDLPDGGAKHFADVITSIKKRNPPTHIEVLIPDFQGSLESLKIVADAKPLIINHNVETVPGLYPEVRPSANYKRSLELLKNSKKLDASILTKSGIMLGLGEKEVDVVQVMKDLRESDCDFLTVGQYLAPSKLHHPVIEYIHPDVFEKYKKTGLELGFKFVASGPFVRSSYHAGENYHGI